MDTETIFWIILLVFYLIYQVVGGKKRPQRPPTKREPEPHTGDRREVEPGLDEALREIREMLNPQPHPRQEPAPAQRPGRSVDTTQRTGRNVDTPQRTGRSVDTPQRTGRSVDTPQRTGRSETPQRPGRGVDTSQWSGRSVETPQRPGRGADTLTWPERATSTTKRPARPKQTSQMPAPRTFEVREIPPQQLNQQGTRLDGYRKPRKQMKIGPIEKLAPDDSLTGDIYRHPLLAKLGSTKAAREAVILTELLGPPKSLRKRGSRL